MMVLALDLVVVSLLAGRRLHGTLLSPDSALMRYLLSLVRYAFLLSKVAAAPVTQPQGSRGARQITPAGRRGAPPVRGPFVSWCALPTRAGSRPSRVLHAGPGKTRPASAPGLGSSARARVSHAAASRASPLAGTSL